MSIRAMKTEEIDGLIRVYLFPVDTDEVTWWQASAPMTISPKAVDLVLTSDTEPTTLRLLLRSGRILGLEFEDEENAQNLRDILEMLITA